MAITLVGTASNFNTAGGSYSVTFPGGVQQNDVVYVFHSQGGGTGGLVTTSGYTNLFSNTAASTRTYGYRKVMGASPDSSVTIGAGTSNIGSTALVVVLRGVDITTPEDATSVSQSSDTSGTNPDPPSITTVTNGAWVLAMAASGVNDAAITAPSGYSNLVNANAATIINNSSGLATKEVTVAGAENPGTFTNWASGNWRAASIAVRPAPAAGGARSFGFIIG